MTSVLPVPAHTSSGIALNLVSLPQTELLTINVSNIPMIRDAMGPGIHVQPLRLDVEAGVWMVLATFSPGSQVPLHYHTGIAETYTLSGKWYYLEYPDQPQTAGSYLYEPSGSVHTLVIPETNTEDTVMLARVEGSNINFSEDGQFHSILDAVMIHHLTTVLSEEQGLGPINYIGGGEAGFTAQLSARRTSAVDAKG
jgi:quercetin dioxygenase-like cupin family protein